MKRIIIGALMGLAATATSISLTSCGDDFLDVDAYSIVSPEGVYSDKENVFKGLMGVYYSLLGASDYYIKPHPALANYPTLDVQADGWDAEMSSHSWTVESKSAFFENAWIYSYKTVVACNLFLRDLEGVINSLLTYSIVYNTNVDMRLAERVVKRAVKIDNKPLTVDDILEKVCNHYNVSQQNVFSKSRKRDYVMVRQISMYLAQKYTKMPASRIGQLIGGRDHSTVIHSCSTVEQRLKVDKSFSAELTSIENSFKLKK